ncbi:Alpha/Beta hydrolase fold [Phytophthora cactorum]|nr:Alpha/Beta hydrolase fold [Phytophthora cactorum]
MRHSRLQVIGALFLNLVLLLSVLTSALEEVHEAALVEEAAVDPDVGKTVVEIVQARGYAIETHQVTTADRYVLTMYRLPKTYAESRSGATAAANKPAVHLQHGLLDSSFTFVSNFRNQSLAYVLADAGFDVWLGNNRGTTWSRSHLDYTTDDDKFWDFTWEDMGLYDLPAFLNHILDTTGRLTVSYVGHSEGTTQAFVGFSKNQEVAKKVDYFGALAPVAWTGHATAALFVAMAKLKVDVTFLNLGFASFLPHSDLLTVLLSDIVCTNVAGICNSAIGLIAGPSDNLNATRIPVYLSQTPAGTSVRNMAHYAQGIRDNTFASYDYGCSCLRVLGINLCSTLICKNKAVYGSFDPPAYPVGSMVYPRTGFYIGATDTFATPTDIAQIRSGLPSGTIVNEKTIDAFSHLDFTWARNANELVYQDLLVQLRNISIGVSLLFKVAVFGTATSFSVNILVDVVLLPVVFGLLSPVEAEWRFLLSTGGRVIVAVVLAAGFKLLPRSFTVGEALLVAQGIGLCACDLLLVTINRLNEYDVIDLQPRVLHSWLIFDVDRPDNVLALEVGMLGSLLVCVALIPLLRSMERHHLLQLCSRCLLTEAWGLYLQLRWWWRRGVSVELLFVADVESVCVAVRLPHRVEQLVIITAAAAICSDGILGDLSSHFGPDIWVYFEPLRTPQHCGKKIIPPLSGTDAGTGIAL